MLLAVIGMTGIYYFAQLFAVEMGGLTKFFAWNCNPPEFNLPTK
jgi:hypothetical protein